MTTFDIIKKLSTDRGKNLKDVAKELGFGENLFYKWKTQSPTAEKLQKVADYFDVTTDYLLGRTENPNTSDELGDEDLITFFRLNTQDLSEDDKEKLKEELKDYLEFMKKKLEK